jgi:hypothetical protein
MTARIDEITTVLITDGKLYAIRKNVPYINSKAWQLIKSNNFTFSQDFNRSEVKQAVRAALNYWDLAERQK